MSELWRGRYASVCPNVKEARIAEDEADPGVSEEKNAYIESWTMLKKKRNDGGTLDTCFNGASV